MKFDRDAIELIAAQVAFRCTMPTKLDNRTFVAFFGVDSFTMTTLWDQCDRPPKTHPKHLMWTLMEFKLYCPDDVMVVLCDCSRNTWSKWVGLWTEALANYSTKVILWQNRFRNMPAGDVWCLVSVDGTDFKMCEPSPFHKAWMSPKFGGAALKYEVAISIYSGDIVWVYGPHMGSKNDVKVFNEGLSNMLEDGEMAETDTGYWMAATGQRRTPKECEDLKEYIEKSGIRARHETVNHRFKVFGILKQEFRKRDRTEHGRIFKAIAGIVQLDISLGKVPFSQRPTTNKKSKYYTSNINIGKKEKSCI